MSRHRNTTRTGQRFSQSTVEAVWRKGRIVPEYDSSRFRKDSCDMWMERRAYGAVRLSPDGTRLAVKIDRADGFDVWVHDLLQGTWMRLT